MRKLWILTSETLPEFTGGIARYIENMTACLKQQDVAVTIIARTTGKSRIEEREGVVYCFFQPWYDRSGSGGVGRKHPAYPYNVIGYWPGLSFQAAQEVKMLLRDHPPPDAVEVQDYGALGYFLVQEKLLGEPLLQNIPIFVHLHGPTFDLGPFNHESGFKFPDYWIGRMERYTILAADAVLSPSQFLAQRVARVTGRESGTSTIPYALPEALANSAATAVTGRDLLYFGRLELRKGVRELVAACEDLWRDGLDFRLRLAGSDTEWTVRGRGASVRQWLEQRHAAAVSAGRLCFDGALQGEDLWRAIRAARAVVIPSLWENFPNTCIEAMALARPVIVSSTGGQAEMVQRPGVDGLVFDWSAPATFQAAVQQVLDWSNLELEEMGQAARRSIQETCSASRVGVLRVRHLEELKSVRRDRRHFPSPNPEWLTIPRESLVVRRWCPSEKRFIRGKCRL
jgi:glycosyltransferase involved in cell wall biosynthesis